MTMYLLKNIVLCADIPLPAPLYASNCQVNCAMGDASAAEDAAFVLREACKTTEKPLQGIMHAGAVLESKVIANITSGSIRTEYSGAYSALSVNCVLLFTECAAFFVVTGKVYGAQNLLQYSTAAALSTLQLFSSLAAFSGAAGQASYAAANGTLDAWAHEAQSQGRIGLAVQWGNWGGGGMAVRNAGFIERMERMGLGIGEVYMVCLYK